MTMWTIQRIETNPNQGDVGLECLEGEQPWKVTLKDTDTGSVEAVTLCVNPTYAPCHGTFGVLKLLSGAGYTPADWNTECGF